MSMSTHVIGFIPPDKKWLKMKSVWDACEIAGVPVPDEVSEFFGALNSPDPAGVEVEIEGKDCCEEWSDDYRTGYQIDVTKLPKHVHILRFYNSF